MLLKRGREADGPLHLTIFYDQAGSSRKGQGGHFEGGFRLPFSTMSANHNFHFAKLGERCLLKYNAQKRLWL